MFPGQCGNTAFFFKSQPDQFHFEFRGIVFPGKSFFSAHEVSTCKISGCLSYRILDSGPDGTQTTLTEVTYQRAGDNYGVGLLIDESALERVEVVKGPYSVLYGSQAIGGIVNFITKKGESPDSLYHLN